MWSFAIDFIPAVRTSHYHSHETELEAATENALEDGNGRHNGVAGHNGSVNGHHSQPMSQTNGSNGYANGRVVNGVHYPNGHKPEVVEPSRNF